MKTIKIYKFSELSEEAKQTAIENYRNKDHDYQFNYDEIIGSVKAAIDLFGLKTGNTWDDLRFSHIDDNILELSGVRLYKYIVNNYWNGLYKPKYIKHLDRHVNWKQFVCKNSKGYRDNKYCSISSRNFITNSCVLTGVCYDDDILKPIYEFLKTPDKNTTFEDLLSDIEHAIKKTFNDTEEWLNSDEFINDELSVNDSEFTEDGKII